MKPSEKAGRPMKTCQEPESTSSVCVCVCVCRSLPVIHVIKLVHWTSLDEMSGNKTGELFSLSVKSEAKVLNYSCHPFTFYRSVLLPY